MGLINGLDGRGHREAWIGAIVGGYMAKEGADKANAQNAKGGWTDVTTTTSPSDKSSPYRDYAMQQAYSILNGGATPAWQQPYNRGNPTNRPGEGPAGNGTQNPGGVRGVLYDNQVPATTTKPAKPDKKPAKPGRGGGGGGGGGQAGADGGRWNGTSANTNTVVNAAIREAQRGNPLYDQSEDFISDTLAGVDHNGYRTETADMIRDLDDQDLKRYKDLLFADYEATRAGYNAGGGAGMGAGGGRTGGGSVVTRVKGTASTPGNSNSGAIGYRTAGAQAAVEAKRSGPVGVVDDLQALLEGQGAPQKVKDVIAKRNEEEWNKRIAEKMGMYVGNNQLGSSSWTAALGDVNTMSARELGDSLAVADYGLYQQGLQLGSEYDLSTLDRESRERMSAADRDAALRASSNAAGGMAEAARLEAQSRMDLARLDALGQAVGMGQRQGEFKTSAMGSLADLYGQDQRFALGATPDITGLGMRDWTAAGQLSLGSDQNRNQWDIGKRNADASTAAARMSANAQNARLNFDRQRYEHDVPFMDLSRYMDIINSADRGGTSRTFGQTPSGLGSINSGMAAVGGAAAGYNLGNAFQQTYGGGN